MSVAFTEIAIRILSGYSKWNLIGRNLWYNIVYLYVTIYQYYRIGILQIQSLTCFCKILICYGIARLCRNKCSICNEGQEFVPRLTFRVQTGDKNVEKIGITKENTFPKTIILPYLSRF